MGIGLESAPGARVANTIFFDHTYNAIEYRFSSTTGVQVANNLVNRPIIQRNSADAVLAANITGALSEWFVDVQAGDLHLAYPVADVVDQGVPVDLLQDDVDRQMRPMGMGIDIGADEITACQHDRNADGDVDGKDLADFSHRFGKLEI